VVKALAAADKAERAATKAAHGSAPAAAHVPYRNSVLTWLLKESLGGNARTTMLAAVSPAASAYDETVSTLKYAERAKRMRTKAVANARVSDEHLIAALRGEVAALRAELHARRSSDAQQPLRGSSSSSSGSNDSGGGGGLGGGGGGSGGGGVRASGGHSGVGGAAPGRRPLGTGLVRSSSSRAGGNVASKQQRKAARRRPNGGGRGGERAPPPGGGVLSPVSEEEDENDNDEDDEDAGNETEIDEERVLGGGDGDSLLGTSPHGHVFGRFDAPRRYDQHQHQQQQQQQQQQQPPPQQQAQQRLRPPTDLRPQLPMAPAAWGDGHSGSARSGSEQDDDEDWAGDGRGMDIRDFAVQRHGSNYGSSDSSSGGSSVASTVARTLLSVCVCVRQR
jgi:hypothetical protein